MAKHPKVTDLQLLNLIDIGAGVSNKELIKALAEWGIYVSGTVTYPMLRKFWNKGFVRTEEEYGFSEMGKNARPHLKYFLTEKGVIEREKLRALEQNSSSQGETIKPITKNSGGYSIAQFLRGLPPIVK